MDTSARFFLTRDMQASVRDIQKAIFEIVEDIRTEDGCNVEGLKSLLGEEMAARFMIFQENRAKAIRKKILDKTGDLNRDLIDILNDYIIDFKADQGVIFETKPRQ